MAAHIYRAMLDFVGNNIPDKDKEAEAKLFGYALQYAQLGDCLESDDWERFFIRTDPTDKYSLFARNEQGDFIAKPYNEVYAICKDLLPKYYTIWESLNCPRTAEDWLRKKYALV